MNDLTFTPLERQVFECLLAGEDPVFNLLRQQFHSSIIKSRLYTGVGYYLKLNVPHNMEEILPLPNVKPLFCFGDIKVDLIIGNSKQEVGFLVWVKDGYLDQLEVYTYGDEKWPIDFDDYHICYIDEPRCLDDLRQNWKQ